MQAITEIFTNPVLNDTLLKELEFIPDPRSRYLIAITPRSGSTYLCDAIRNTKHLGRPQEWLSADAVANRISKNMPGRTPEEYLRNGLRVTKSPNGVSGLKASWFQFENFIQVMNDQRYLKGLKYVYLTRRDLVAQAVSLYKATASNVFHTNIQYSEEVWAKLDTLEYNFKTIKQWYEHIIAQEKGWQRYFLDNRIYPYCLSYEDIEEDIYTVLKRLAVYVSVEPGNLHLPEEISELKKLRDQRSLEWTDRFRAELSLNALH